jgi:hypothetical protein
MLTTAKEAALAKEIATQSMDLTYSSGYWPWVEFE